MPFKDIEARRAWSRKYYQEKKDVINSRPCRKSAGDRWRERNRTKLREIGKENYWDNKEQRIKSNKEWRKKNGAEYERKRTESLNDTYIRKNLIKKGWTRKAIRENPDLIEIERTIIKIKRLCKTSQN